MGERSTSPPRRRVGSFEVVGEIGQGGMGVVYLARQPALERDVALKCIRRELLVDPARSEVDMWVNGTEVPDLHRMDWQQDPVGALRFGFEKYAGPDADIWYDDVAVGTDRLGCD